MALESLAMVLRRQYWTRRRSWRLAALAVITSAVAFAVACRMPKTERSPLETVDRPPDFAQLDKAVRDQFDDLWQRLEKAEAGSNPSVSGAAWGAVGQWFDIYGYGDSAERCYRRARSLVPDDPHWPYYLGRLAETAGDFSAAQACFVAAGELAPTEAAPRVRLADILLQLQELDRAEALYDEVLETAPDNPGALFGSARVAQMRGHPEAALDPLLKLVERQPEAVQVRYALAVVWRDLGNDDRAAQELEKVPDDNLDQISLSRDDPWDDELQRLNQGARSFTRRGVRAFRRGDRERAVKLLGQAVIADPSGPEKRINYALALREAGRWGDAAEQLEEALSRSDEGSDFATKAHLEYGRLLAVRGRPVDAAAHLEQALAIDPRSVPAHVELGRLDHRFGRLEAACDHYASARAVDPTNPTIGFWHAALLSILNRRDEAVEAVEEDLRRVGDDRLLDLLLARLLVTDEKPHGGDIDSARQILEEFGGTPDAMYAETAAMVAAAAGDFGLAQAWQRAVIDVLADARPRTSVQTARRRLVLYERREPCRTPWESREAVMLVAVTAP